MDGVHNVYREGRGFVSRHYYPKNTKEIVSIGLYLLITFYLTDYFLNFRLFKWIYLGTIVILIASWYREDTRVEGLPLFEGLAPDQRSGGQPFVLGQTLSPS